MTDLTPEQRARALEMWRSGLRADGVSEYALPNAIAEGNARYWLAAEAHALAAHECPTVPVWRPTTRDEIQAGWEVRSRSRLGSELGWGTAHHQDSDGDWRTEAGSLLTYTSTGLTYETTAPLSAPDPRIAVVMEWYGSTTADHAGIAGLLARLDNLKVVEYSEPHSN